MSSYDLSDPQRPTIPKKEHAELDYTWDWTAWLAGVSDTLASYTITVATGLTKTADAQSGGKVIANIKGGSAGSTYAATCKIITTAGRTDERSIYLRVE